MTALLPIFAQLLDSSADNRRPGLAALVASLGTYCVVQHVSRASCHTRPNYAETVERSLF